MQAHELAERIRINEEIRQWNAETLNPWSDHYSPDPVRRANAMAMVGFAERRIRELQTQAEQEIA